MRILFLVSSIFCGALQEFQKTSVTDKQPFAYTKVEYIVNGASRDLKSSNISVSYNPLCYQTIVRGKNPKGFAQGELKFSFLADKNFTTPSNNSVYTLQAPKNFRQLNPIDLDASSAFILETSTGTIEFCIIIDQNPFIGVSTNEGATPPELQVTAENIPNKGAEDYVLKGITPPVPIEFVTSSETTYSTLVYNCARAIFRKCLEAAVIDCVDSIDKGISKILFCHKLKEIRCFIAERCKKMQVCPPSKPQPCLPYQQPCPPYQQPCPPYQQPCPPYQQPCPTTPCPSPMSQFQFLDICIRATILLGQCIIGGPGSQVYNLRPFYSKPYNQFITECDKICFPSVYRAGTGGLGGGIGVSSRAGLLPGIKPIFKSTLTSQKKPSKKDDKKAKKDEDDEDDEDEKEESRFSTGAYIAGGVGAVVVVSVCVYVGYQFFS